MKENIKKVLCELDDIYSKSKSLISKLDNTGFKEPEKILGILILERIVGNLRALIILLTEILNYPNIEPAIGLILRNNLSLCKVVFYYSELMDKNLDSSLFFKSVFGENIQRSIKDIKKCHSTKKVDLMLENIETEYAFLLREIGVNLKTVSIEKFKLNIKLSNKFKSLDNLFNVFSKYEHFGLNTLLLQNNNDGYEKLNRIKIAIHYSLQGILVCLTMLEIYDEELMKINQNLSSEL